MTRLAINDVYTSLQGEGTLAGTPMIILRLQGCNVGCPWCDTRETWDLDMLAFHSKIDDILGKNTRWTRASADEIVEYIAVKFPRIITWVLITGGEPAMNELGALVQALHGKGYKVALETSGTAPGCINANFDWVCVSPKMHSHLPVIPAVLHQANELKTVIGKPEDVRRLEANLGEWKEWLRKDCIISLQPVSLSKKATDICYNQVMLKGWRLSLQFHRYLELP